MANPVQNCTVIRINPWGIVCQYTTSFGFVTRNTALCVNSGVRPPQAGHMVHTQYTTGLHWNVLHMASIMWPHPLMGMYCTLLGLAHLLFAFSLFHNTQCRMCITCNKRVWPLHSFVTHSCLWTSYLLTAVWALYINVKHWIDRWALQVYNSYINLISVLVHTMGCHESTAVRF